MFKPLSVLPSFLQNLNSWTPCAMPGTYEALDQYNPAPSETGAISRCGTHCRLLLSSSDLASPCLPQQPPARTALTPAARAEILVPWSPQLVHQDLGRKGGGMVIPDQEAGMKQQLIMDPSAPAPGQMGQGLLGGFFLCCVGTAFGSTKHDSLLLKASADLLLSE